MTPPTPRAALTPYVSNLTLAAMAHFVAAVDYLDQAGEDQRARSAVASAHINLYDLEHVDPSFGVWVSYHAGLAVGLMLAAESAVDTSDVYPGSAFNGADRPRREAAARFVLDRLSVDADMVGDRVLETAVTLMGDGMPVGDALRSAEALER